MLDIPYLLSIHNVLNVPHRKKSSEKRSGLRGGQGIGPLLPIQASENFSFTSVTKQLKWEGDLSCINYYYKTLNISEHFKTPNV
jgi:hypothetical protein